MPIKYAALSFRKDLELSAPFVFDQSTYLVATNVASVFEPGKTDHWRKWIGEIPWEELKRDRLSLFTWMPTKNPGVLDEENKELTTRINSAWYALLLGAGRPPFWGGSHQMTGTGELSNGAVDKVTVRQFSNMFAITRPYYVHCTMRYIEQRTNMHGDPPWPDEIKTLYNLLETRWRAARAITSIIRDALESLKDARCAEDPGTAIARFVEAAEAVLAMPKGKAGKMEFASRAMAMLSPYKTDSYLDWPEPNLKDVRLIELYELRNSRNHGKGTFDSVCDILGSADKDVVNDAVGRWYYLAEHLARRSIRHLLEHADGPALATKRALLEAAWDAGTFP